MGIEAGGFGIEHDLAHWNSYVRSRRIISPGRHLSNRRKDLPHLRARMLHALRAIHHEIRPPALFRVGHLPRQQRFELLQV